MKRYSVQLRNTQVKGRKKNTFLFIFHILLLCIVCGLGCRQKAPTETDANVPKPEAGAKAQAVAVTVNGMEITESDVQVLVEPALEQIAIRTSHLPPEFVNQQEKRLRQQVLEKLIVEKLLDAEVEKANIEVTEQEAMERIEAMASNQQPPLSVEDIRSQIEARGRDFDEFKQQIQRQLGYNKLFQSQHIEAVDISEDEVKQYYSEHSEDFVTPERVRASHILIKPDESDPNTDPNQAKAEARAKIEELLKQIQNGEDFAELAKVHSACPSSVRGGDLDFFGRGQMVAPFEKAAFELKPGQVSDIVETEFGYHIIKVTDHNDAVVIPFDQAKDSIIAQLRHSRQREIVEQYIQSLKAKAEISYPSGKEPASD